jgi:hypothetical protein
MEEAGSTKLFQLRARGFYRMFNSPLDIRSKQVWTKRETAEAKIETMRISLTSRDDLIEVDPDQLRISIEELELVED